MNSAVIKNKNRDGQEGIALMLVLLLVLLLSVIVAEFSYEAQVEASLSGGRGESFAAYVAAKSAVASGFAALHADLLMNMANGAIPLPQNITNPNNQNPPDPTETFDGCTEAWYYHEPLSEMNGAQGNFWISDECGKLNLNALVDFNGQPNQMLVETLKALFRNMEADEEIVDNLIEYICPGASENGGGVDPADAADSPTGLARRLTSIEELLLVPGMTPEIYFDLNETEPPDAGLFNDANQVPRLSLPDLLTVHGDPTGVLNVNTIQVPLMEALLEVAQLSPGDAQTIVSELRAEPARNVQELPERIPGVNADQVKGLSCKSSFFRIQGDGWVDNTMVRIETFVYRNEEQIMFDSGQQIPDKKGLTDKDDPKDKEKAKEDDSKKDSEFGPKVKPGEAPMEAFKILDWRVIR